MILVFRAIGDPSAKDFFLDRIQSPVGLRRGYDQLGIWRGNSLNQFAHRRLSGHDRLLSTVSRRSHTASEIQSQSALQRLGIRAMARKALAGRDRSHIAVEIDVVSKRD